MNPKKVLLLHEDRLLTNLFREKLEAAGFAVESAHSSEAGLAALAERKPDAVVMDPVLPGAPIGEVVRTFRSSDGKRPTPVIVLATGRAATSDAAREAGADIVLTRGVNPAADVIDAIQTQLGLERTSAVLRTMPFHADESWLATSLDLAQESLTTLRRALHEASREGGAGKAMMEFYRCIHGFAEQMATLGQRPLHCFAAQIETLAADLSRFPEMGNPAVLRTLGQSVDFLSSLLPEAVRTRLKDPGAAQVLVVDDEEGARAIIMGAMRLANLKAMAADTPSASLAALGVQGFDLIFLDVGLPEMNGFELCNKIRAMPMHEKTPVIFITGMVTFQNRVQSSLSGGNDFVGKPFNLPELGLKALVWIFRNQLGQV